ncbi:MAG: DUF2249 domain-containing protein [Pseudomonadota bacterium]|nr:DUF2249 domain-containing protein [Pseudomonadota bacterium]
MITASTSVADALAERPSLRDVLPAFHPAFAKLNHPILGRILPRLATVADAARMVGVDLDTLVAVMNLPDGRPVPTAQPAPRPPSAPAPVWFDPSDPGGRVTLLDARPLLAANEDPLARILAALRGLPPGGQLTVIAPFEPVPLVGLLARQGWSSWTRWDGADCRVTFSHGDVVVPDPVGLGGAGEPADAGGAEREEGGWRIDVSTLPPPEPMRRVLAAVDTGALPLRVIHAREPALLYPKLVERGLVWEVRPRAGGVEIHVRRP